MNAKLNRRQILKSSLGILSLGNLNIYDAFVSPKPSRFKIGACDWSIGKHSQIEALETAKKIGLDGVQISLGTTDNDMHLRQERVQQLYREASEKYSISLGGIAIGEMNKVPYKSDPRAELWVSDSIDVAKNLGCGVVLLAFFSNGDLKGDQEGIKEVIKRLKKIAPKAEANGIVLGIESWLSAKEHMEIIDAIGSPNVQVYYDVANSNHMGYNIYEEIRWLGKEHICEFHAKENNYLLGQGKVDFNEVRKVIDDIDYEGWIVLEGAIPEKADMYESYVQNNAYIRSVFNN